MPHSPDHAAAARAAPANLACAEVGFDGGRPFSRRFGDIYHDADGPAEAERVFLGPANIAARAARRGSTFTVGELGFGAGLNFLAAAAAARARLHFVSFEAYPLARADLRRALAPWRGELPLAAELEAAYPPPVPGWHRRFFDGARVQLSVYFGDVAAGMADFARQQRRGVDAWFLDGFAPSRNPDMWRGELFHVMAAMSAPGATATTFTAAGAVRRGLAAAGFAVRRVDQLPRKRHSTAAVLRGGGRAFSPPESVAVFGAGMAGAATARALAEKGMRVALHDRGEGVAGGASAIPAAVLRPRLLAGDGPEAARRVLAYSFAAARCRGLPGVAATGVVQVAGPRADAERLARIAASMPQEIARHVEEAASLAGVGGPGLYFPGGLTIDGRAFSSHLVRHPGIELATGDVAGDLVAVYATGAEIGEFGFLEVAPVAGQMDRFACATPLLLPVVGDGVLVPATEGVWAGATYEHGPWPAKRATAANAARFQRVLGRWPGASLARFRGVRAVTSDRLPVVGRDGDVWFNLGHGSHGTTTAVHGAEIVASAINGEVAPATTDMLARIAPGRFRARQRRRPIPLARRR